MNGKRPGNWPNQVNLIWINIKFYSLVFKNYQAGEYAMGIWLHGRFHQLLEGHFV
jgi:hypothetical protein